MKFHNYFEKKEVEFKNKIAEKFQTKKFKNIMRKDKNLTKLETDKDYDEKENNNNNEEESSSHPNIIKIIL